MTCMKPVAQAQTDEPLGELACLTGGKVVLEGKCAPPIAIALERASVRGVQSPAPACRRGAPPRPRYLRDGVASCRDVASRLYPSTRRRLFDVARLCMTCT